MRVAATEVCIKFERPALQALAVAVQQTPVTKLYENLLGLMNGTGRGLPSEELERHREPGLRSHRDVSAEILDEGEPDDADASDLEAE
jgi:hypothetical protein